MRRGRLLPAGSRPSRSNEPQDRGDQPSDSIQNGTSEAAQVSAPPASAAQPTAPAPISAPESAPPPAQNVSTRPRGGRGGLIMRQMANLSLRSGESPSQASPAPQAQTPTQVPARPAQAQPTAAAAPPGAPQLSSSSSSGHLSRAGSDLSRSSVLSQQFAAVQTLSYKANLPKGPTTSGTGVKLSTNYLTFDIAENTSIEEYHVDFNPNIESIRLRYQVLRTEESKALIGQVIHWTGTNLYLPKRLPQGVTEFSTQHPVTNTPLSVKLTFVKTPPDSELMPFYNSLMHKVMNKLRYVIINRQHYSPLHKIPIQQHKLEVWPGWVTSIQRLDGGIKLSVDASFRVLRLETVRDIMVDIRNRQQGMNLKEAFERELIGAIVMTRYNNKAYRIDELDLTKKPTDTFAMTRDDNRQISYVDYMREHWNVEVRDLGQPMIIHRPKPKRGQETSEEVYLIPELCVTTGLTDEMRSNFTIMKALAEHTRLPPEIRETKLLEFVNQVATDERAKTVLSDWNLAVRPTLDILDGRRLDNESVYFGQNKVVKVPDNVDWTRAATSNPVFKSVEVKNWVIMYPEKESSTANRFLETIQQLCRAQGAVFGRPRIVLLPNDRPATYIEYGKREVKPSDQMVVLLTPGKSQREDRYSACKRLYSCDLPVPCQFIRCGTIFQENKLRSVCQKILIQVISKVGGQPWAMKFPMQSFMVIGMDVYHDTIDRKKSCVGFVASMNSTCSSWWSRTFFQSSLEEIGQKLSTTMISALRKYHTLNGHIPQKIIVYRDGVGDGQLETVLEVEVAQAMDAIKFYMRDAAQPEMPHVSYIIVQKRINAKLSLRANGRVMNPMPGTFLDHTITHPEYNDFYLVSQHVNQGTVAPTKYIVITETGQLKMAHHQKLAYKLTHMYYNWCGTIRVPAPCQYAHKLAYLTGQNIRQQANERLEDKLYYL